jgi:hypothetical protein
MRVIVRWTTFAATLALVGCTDGPPSLDGGSIATVPAKGRVMLAGGKPLTNGMIRIEPLVDGGSTNQAMGEIQGDGSFELRSSASTTGAMPGKYRVLIENATTRLKVRPGKEPEVEVKEGQDIVVKLP